MHERLPTEPDLPEDLLEVAAERLLAVSLADRARVLADLVREDPGREAPLRRLASDLAATERLLGTGFSAPAESMAEIGPYRVVRRIGEGAFGIVYLCAQEAPVRREVAVKVLRPGTGDRHTLARFEAERHVLATLSHPAIAQVFDAGALADGRPYFVMEYVRGLPITSYCDEHQLEVDARLALFVRLCQGAQHAHAQGIVHRDFKPANVLVFEQDGQAQPKIIDFGIAKAVHPTEHGAEVRTEIGRVIGTPGYMSPEQSAGSGTDLDARADVFSLGVMLYELLTGELPWGRRPTTTDSDPPRPSARVATAATGDVARQRSIPSRKLASRLRGDLDWIVLKAIARQRERRYACAQELADDIVHHLRGEPVRAGPPTIGYRLRKFARRHRAAVWAAGLVLLVSALGLWLSLSFRAQAEHRTADVQAAAAGLLARARDPVVIDAPQSASLRQALLQDALALYEALLRERPIERELQEGRARALETLSQVHWLVGDYARSEAVAREATAAAEALLEVAPDSVIYRGLLGNVLCSIGRASYGAGQVDAGRAAFDRAVREIERCHAQAPAAYARLLAGTLMEWSSCLPYADHDARAEARRRAARILDGELAERPSLPVKLDLLDVLGSLGQVLTERGELDAAGEAFQRAEELLASTPEAGPSYVCKVQHLAAGLAAREGDHQAAIGRLQEAIQAARRWSDQEPNQPRPWQALAGLHDDLARQHLATGDDAAATAASRAAIAAGETAAARFPGDLVARGHLAYQHSWLMQDLLGSGRRANLAEAETSARRALELLASLPATFDRRIRARARWEFLHDLARVLTARGGDDVRAHWQAASQATAAWCEEFGVSAEDAPPLVIATLRLARHHLDAGADDRAAEALAQVEAVCREHALALQPLLLHLVETHRLRALLAARRGDDVQAAESAERALELGEGWRGGLAAAEGMAAAWRAARTAGADERAAGHRDRAIELHRGAIGGLREAVAASPEDPWLVVPLGLASIRLAELLLDHGERQAAQELLDQALPALAALREEVHAECWDEDVYVAGQAMAGR